MEWSTILILVFVGIVGFFGYSLYAATPTDDTKPLVERRRRKRK